MRIVFEEQDLINAIAVDAAIEYHGGEFDGCNPETVTVKLQFDKQIGIHAVATRPFHHTIYFDHQRIMDAMAQYLEIYHTFNPEVLEHEITYFHDENRYEGISSIA